MAAQHENDESRTSANLGDALVSNRARAEPSTISGAIGETAATSAGMKSAADPGADGAPKTTWGVLGLLCATIPICAWVFKTWDLSDFPETFTSEWFWFWIAVCFLAATIWSSLLPKRSQVDKVLLVFLCISTVAVGVIGLLVRREAAPSLNAFTVDIFKSRASDDETQRVAARIREQVLTDLEKIGQSWPKEFSVNRREREVKGGREESISYVRKWAHREDTSVTFAVKPGAHLAMWIELGVSKDGASFEGRAHFIKVAKFGKEIHAQDSSDFGGSGEYVDTFTIAKVGSNESPDLRRTDDGIVQVIDFFWGLANYRKGNYDIALRILPQIKDSSAQRYAGRAAEEKAYTSRQALAYFHKAQEYFKTALSMMDRSDPSVPSALMDLGLACSQSFAYGDDLEATVPCALNAFDAAAEIYRSRASLEGMAGVLKHKAFLEYNLYERSPIGVGQDHLRNAEALLKEAIPHLSPKSTDYRSAKSLEGTVLGERDEYREAIKKYEEVLRLCIDAGDSETAAKTSRILGNTQTYYAIESGSPAVYAEAQRSLERSAQSCAPDLLECYLSHRDSGNSALRWAKAEFRRGSTEWKDQVDRAVKEYGEAKGFLSGANQPFTFAEASCKAGGAYTERSFQTRPPQKDDLLAALGELNDAIGAQPSDESARPLLAALLRKRAAYYRRLHWASRAAGYLDLARKDEEESAKIRNSGTAKVDAIPDACREDR